MEKDVKQRILDVFDYYQTNANKIAGTDSAFQNRLSRQLNQGSTLTCDTILRILRAFPDVSPQWVLLGEGPKLLSQTPEPAPIQANETTTAYAPAQTEMQLRINKLEIEKNYLEEYNARLIADNERLKDTLKDSPNYSKHY